MDKEILKILENTNRSLSIRELTSKLNDKEIKISEQIVLRRLNNLKKNKKIKEE